MSYKDKDKQREANRKAQQRRRELVRQGTKGEEGMTDEEIDNIYEGMTLSSLVIPVIPKTDIRVIPKQGSTDTLRTEAESLQHKSGSDTMSVKRGKDIKVFADLPPAAQLAINTISENEAEHKRRTAIAINYQHATCSMTKGGVKYR